MDASFKGSSCTAILLLLIMTQLPTARAIKIILMYAGCDDQLTYLLHLLHKSIRPHFSTYQEDEADSFKNRELFRGRHDLDNACTWVLQETLAVVAISDEREHWEGLDISAHDYNLPHLVSPNLCQCNSYLPPSHFQYIQFLERAVFDFLRDEFLQDVVIIYEEDYTAGAILASLLSVHSVRVSHLRLTKRLDLLKTVERYFESWNMMDLSDAGRLLISLGNGSLVDNLLNNLVQSSMHNKRTKLLVVDSPVKWQAMLKNVMAYEVDVVVVSPDPLPLDDCPVAIEFFPAGSENHDVQGPCTNLSSENKEIGDAIIHDFQRNFYDCCHRHESNDTVFIFWSSWLFENGTQRLKPEGVWSRSLGLLRTLPIDLEPITLRIAVLQYRPYVLINTSDGNLVLLECVFKRVIDFLSQKLNFKYRLVAPADGQWGTKTDGKWDGSIGMVTRGEADIIPYSASTPIRREAIDFSKPLAHVQYGLLVAFPSEPPRAFIFLRPYKREVWLLFIVAAFVVSFILYKIHLWSCKFCKPDKRSVRGLSTFFRCLWLIFGAMLNQGGVHLPVTNSARVVLASWWLAVLVVMATFSANLIAFLAFPEAKWEVQSLSDMTKHPKIELTIKQDCPVLEDFKESNVEISRQIRQIFLDNSRRGNIIRVRRSEIVEQVVEGKTVFIDDLNYLNRMVEKDYKAEGSCRMTIARNHFSSMVLALGFRRGSSLLGLVNEEIQQLQESGVLQYWKERFSPQREECFDFNPSLHGQSEISLEDLQGPFYLLAIGMVFGSLFLTCEYVYMKANTAYRKYLKRKFFKRHCSIMYW